MTKCKSNNNAKTKTKTKVSSITLYPPLETESDITAAGEDENENENSNMLLSRELKRSFDTVRDIHLAQLHKKRLKEKKGGIDVVVDKAVGMDMGMNMGMGMDMSMDMSMSMDSVAMQEEEFLDAKKFEAAVAAAVAAESEISTLSKGITELENMLLLHNHESLESTAKEGKEKAEDHGNSNCSGSGSGDASSTDGTPEKFPALPRKVDVQEEDDDHF